MTDRESKALSSPVTFENCLIDSSLLKRVVLFPYSLNSSNQELETDMQTGC